MAVVIQQGAQRENGLLASFDRGGPSALRPGGPLGPVSDAGDPLSLRIARPAASLNERDASGRRFLLDDLTAVALTRSKYPEVTRKVDLSRSAACFRADQASVRTEASLSLSTAASESPQMQYLRAALGRASVRKSDGQTVVLMVVFMIVIVGAAGLVLDVGSWYRADRAAQATADAAALAGAQKLIAGTAEATALAEEYADKNGGGDPTITFGQRVAPNDLITVDLARPAPSFFTKLFGVDSVQVNARATARAGIPSRARYVAPITVNEQHPMLQCQCFNDPTQVTLINLHTSGSGDAAGAFGLLNLASQQSGGNIGSDTLGSWIRDGYQDELPLGMYDSAPSANFNSSYVRDALRDRLGTELLFPVYRSPISGSGSGAEYNIIAWVGFVPTAFHASGSSGTIEGYFTKVIWQGLADETGSVPDFGVRVIQLVE